MNKKILLSILTFSMLSLTSYANEVKLIDQKDINTINNYAKTTIDIDDEIENQIQQYASKNQFEFGLDSKSGKYFIYSLQPVALKPTDPDFVKSLSVAYEKAFFNAQQRFVMDIFGRMISQKESSLYANNSTNAKQFENKKINNDTILDKLTRVVDKSLTLTEKKLDSELENYGVDPKQIEKLTPTQKKTLFKNKFIAKTMKKAYGSVAGFVPIKSFVGKDKTGQYVVGVIAMRSPKTSQVAKDISMQRKSMIKGKGKPLEEIIPSDTKQLLNEFGLRLVFDDTNQPALIAYGQWGFNSKGLDSYMKMQAKENSKSMAKEMADAMISDFVNGNLQTVSSKQHGEIIEKTIEKQGDPQNINIEKTIKNIIDKINQQSKLRSSMDLAGFSTVRRWSTTNEYGHYVSGVIRKWTFKGNDIAKSIINDKPYTQEESTSNSTSSTTRTVEQSAEYNTVNDF